MIKKKLKKNMNSKGATLVELMVTFVLFTILLTSAVTIITPCAIMFEKMKGLTYAQNVSELVMDRIGGEISSASDRVLIDNSGKCLSLTDSTGSPLFIDLYNKETGDFSNYIRMYYRTVLVENEVLWEAVSWTYDEKAYQGYIIEDINFQYLGGNAVRISLELKHNKLEIDYSTERVVECYNLRAGGISYGDVIKDDDQYYQKLNDV